MQFIIRKPWDLPQRKHTPPEVYRRRRQHRREFLQQMGVAAASVLLAQNLSGCSNPTPEEIEQAGAVAPLKEEWAKLYPAERNATFTWGRDETDKTAAAQYTNFYEFSPRKDSWMYVEAFQPSPWTIEVGGLCNKPRTFDLDDLYSTFALEERAYRHRCVETWAMCVPWTGFPLAELLKAVEPQAAAKFVAIESFNRPDQAPVMFDTSYPWPYTEGLTIEEAQNDLAFLATGIYGEPLPKQHGAPVRLVLPWKYGFKSIKSFTRITLTDSRPSTFWNQMSPREYGFLANVDPTVPHPRWSQATEWMLGTYERFPTVVYNGYGEFVGELYA